MTRAEIKSQTLNQLSHPGAPVSFSLYSTTPSRAWRFRASCLELPNVTTLGFEPKAFQVPNCALFPTVLFSYFTRQQLVIVGGRIGGLKKKMASSEKKNYLVPEKHVNRIQSSTENNTVENSDNYSKREMRLR